MPLTAADQRRVDEAEAEAEAAGSTKLLLRSPPDTQKLGSITVMCLIINRTIGSGIYVTPAIVLRATNSVGVSLLLWTLGAIFGICGLLVWLELGLSIPKFQPPDSGTDSIDGEGAFENVPRSGGEKNYLEYIYKDPRFQTTCMYGVIFVILGNLTGNAIAMGQYIMQAAGIPNHEAAVRGIAVAALTAACLIHGLWRNGGIVLNNVLALIKVLTLTAVIVIGFAAAGGASFGNGTVGKAAVKTNFDTHKSFSRPSHDAGSYARSIVYVVYSYSGFKQPFYVLSEVSQPKKRFAKATIATMILVAIMFILANVAYLCAVPKGRITDTDLDMANVFFHDTFGNEIAPRVMSGIIALSIFGNIVVMTFTASRVKQEIAKEGILPFSLFFARSSTTPYAWLKQRFWPSHGRILEQSPATALLLHWFFAVILVAATSSTSTSIAYLVLVLLYAYVLVVMVGFFVASGVLYLRATKRREWTDNLGFRPWGGPTAAIVYSCTCAFMLVGVFITPSATSPFSYATTGVRHYIVPAVGLGTLLIGYSYYLVFAKLIPRWRKKVLIVEREPIIVRQDGRQDAEWVQILEVVEFWWAARQADGKEA
ncbi:MAG: hypothetical protein L6R40_006129 [Gallowayella cf. fulva]|nr:MAG: hypothetical protein L6R40_006129 [Xanthomendoza cf. fulva]